MTIYQGSQVFNKTKNKKPCRVNPRSEEQCAQLTRCMSLGVSWARGKDGLLLRSWGRSHKQLDSSRTRKVKSSAPAGQIPPYATADLQNEDQKGPLSQRLGSFARYLLDRMFQQMQSWLQSDVATTTWGQRHSKSEMADHQVGQRSLWCSGGTKWHPQLLFLMNQSEL